MGQSGRTDNADDQANGHESNASPQYQPHNFPGRRTKSHPNSDLHCALRDGLCDHRVEADSRQEQSDHGEDTSDHGDGPLLTHTRAEQGSEWSE